MKIILNGDERDVGDGCTLADVLRDLRLDDRPVAVERNREVVPKTRLAQTALAPGDRIEIVHLVGGG